MSLHSQRLSKSAVSNIPLIEKYTRSRHVVFICTQAEISELCLEIRITNKHISQGSHQKYMSACVCSGGGRGGVKKGSEKSEFPKLVLKMTLLTEMSVKYGIDLAFSLPTRGHIPLWCCVGEGPIKDTLYHLIHILKLSGT